MTAPVQVDSAPLDGATRHRTDKRKGKTVAPCVIERAGKFQIEYTDPSGKRHRPTLPVGTTLTQAKRELDARKTDVGRGVAVTPSNLTNADLIDDYFKMCDSLVITDEMSENTVRLWKQQWRSRYQRPLGRLKVQQTRGVHHARIYEEMRRDGLAPNTLKNYQTFIQTYWSFAKSRGVIKDSPLDELTKAERPKGRAVKQPRTLTNEDSANLLIHAPSGQWRVCFALAAGTTGRRGEVRSVRWKDLDLAGGMWHLRHQLPMVIDENDPGRVVPLKSDAAARDIYLVPELVAMLKKYKEERFALGLAKPDDLVFSTKDGKPLQVRNMNRAIRVAGDKAGLNPEEAIKAKTLKPVSWHDLRHTAISRLIAAGLDVVEVQRQAGHSKPSITLDIYSHQFEKAKRASDIRAKIEASGLGLALGGGAP
jgi:integrase